MSYARRGLRALGVSILAALGLMAVTAGGASASGTFLVQELAGVWDAAILGKGDNPLDNENRLLVLNLKIEFFCHSGSAGGKINQAGHGHTTVEFKECFASGVNQDGDLIGEICELENDIVAKALAQVVLHSTKPYILFSPLEGEFYGVINTEPCPIPTASLKGNVVANISNPDGDNLVKLLSTKAMLGLFTTDKLFYGKNEAHLDVDGNVELSGAHENKAWGAA